MHLLLSGEGKSDIGRCNPSNNQCDTTTFEPGAMAFFIDQLIEQQLGYDFSHLLYEQVSFVSERYLIDNKLPAKPRKQMSLAGKKKPKETQYFYQNARALAAAAKVKAQEVNDTVIAVLFRDGDGTASAGRGLYRDKVHSMLKGFAAEDFADLGVPMIPNPKSEAWLLCALKNNPYQHCNLLENESGNDNSPNPLKDQLETVLTSSYPDDSLVELVQHRRIDVNRIDMNSFNDFKRHLAKAVTAAQGNQ